MQGPTERHLQRRQQYFTFILQDLLYNAYQRAVAFGFYRSLTTGDYDRLFTLLLPEVSRWDNESLARAAREIATALSTVSAALPGRSRTFNAWSLRLISRFAGEPLSDADIQTMLAEAESD